MRTGVSKFIPKNPREDELATFWYNKGYAEAEIMAVVKQDNRKVSVKFTDKKRIKKRSVKK